jgi:hypothetical protein
MTLHEEKACAGIRALKVKPDFLLHIDRVDGYEPPGIISGIPVIQTPAFLEGLTFGLTLEPIYIPCYKKLTPGTGLNTYLKAYEDFLP